jgi:hypothetical protein
MLSPFDRPRLFRDWFVKTFRAWPKLIWGDPQGTLQAFGRAQKIDGLYGLSVGSRFFGGMKLKRLGAAGPIKFFASVRCSCGQEHSVEDWRKCPMALTSGRNDPWWRDSR